MIFVLVFATNGIQNIVWDIFIISFLLYVVDFITFSFLRKIPYLSYLFFPFFKLFDFVSLRLFIQNSLWMMNTNINKFKLFIGMLTFITFAVFLTYVSIYKTMHWPNMFDSREYKSYKASTLNDLILVDQMYMDNWTGETINNVGISSKAQAGNLMEVYVGYKASYDELIEMTSDIDSLKRFDKIIAIDIDDSLYSNLGWVYTVKLNQSLNGITTIVPIDHLKNGWHKIKIYTKYSTFTKKELEDHGQRYEIEYDIPFWVDR